MLTTDKVNECYAAGVDLIVKRGRHPDGVKATFDPSTLEVTVWAPPDQPWFDRQKSVFWGFIQAWNYIHFFRDNDVPDERVEREARDTFKQDLLCGRARLNLTFYIEAMYGIGEDTLWM